MAFPLEKILAISLPDWLSAVELKKSPSSLFDLKGVNLITNALISDTDAITRLTTLSIAEFAEKVPEDARVVLNYQITARPYGSEERIPGVIITQTGIALVPKYKHA
ncbi:MAG TPA: hypothetical protein VJB94_01275 [Candidatus Nanoarchaeia archaeon]|nr:hypothetical protein [Candidatus Nanoarchaeia archaeon]